MLKEILSKIQKFEKLKAIKVEKQLEMQNKIQNEINEIDIKLKKLYSLKKHYEKLNNDSTEFLNTL